MPKTLTVIAAILVGGLIDLGDYWLMAHLASGRLNRPLRVLCGLLMIAVIWVVVPVGEYYASSSLASASAGYLAACLLFVAGFVMVSFFGERGRYLRDLRKLDGTGQRAANSADDSP